MNSKNVIVVVVDGLNPLYLGPYGNTWLETPACNLLASEGMVCDNAFTGGSDLRATYAKFTAQTSEKDTLLVTDEPELAEHPFSSNFETRVVCRPDEISQAAADVQDCQMLGFFAEAIEALVESEWKLAWLHCRGLTGPWDAPTHLREHFRDEDDPSASTCIASPYECVALDVDPDELLPTHQAYAAQIAVLDQCLEWFMGAVDLSQTTLIFTSTRGFPLGNHGFVGVHPDALFSELLQVPLIVRPAGSRPHPTRLQQFVHLDDLSSFVDHSTFPTSSLSHWRPRELGERDRILAQTTSRSCLRTPAWLGTWNNDNSSASLFVKPADAWEFNNVFDRCGYVIDEMKDLVANDPTGPLSDVLKFGLE